MSILDRFRLDGRVALVTGASSGLGEAFADALASAGATVVLTARRADRLEDVARHVRKRGGLVLTVPADITDSQERQQVIDQTVAEYGALDILVNNAGVGGAMPAITESEAHFRGIVDLNLTAVFLTAQAAARVMNAGSCIINVSSIAAFTSFGLPQAGYASSKAAVCGLTRDLAQQWTGRHGIRVNAVAPGFVETEMTADVFTDGNFGPQAQLVPIGRGGRPDEIASAVVFLASEAASYMTGHVLVVDGGRCVY